MNNPHLRIDIVCNHKNRDPKVPITFNCTVYNLHSPPLYQYRETIINCAIIQTNNTFDKTIFSYKFWQNQKLELFDKIRNFISLTYKQQVEYRNSNHSFNYYYCPSSYEWIMTTLNFNLNIFTSFIYSRLLLIN